MEKYFLLFVCLLINLTTEAQSVLPGPKGVWIRCGNTLSADGSYQIFRKTEKQEWQSIAFIKTPSSYDEFVNRMMQVQQQSALTTSPEVSTLKHAWRYIRQRHADSLSVIAENLPALAGAGLAYYDATARAGQLYDYKITRLENGRAITEKTIDGVQFPGKATDVAFTLKNTTVTKAGIVLEYTFEKVQDLAGVHVWRGYYQRSQPEKINPELLYSRDGKKWKLIVSDHTAAPRVAYSYVIEPYDAAGNSAALTGLANVYNVQKNSIAPSVTNIKARSDEDQKAIRLSWKLANYADVVSVKIYRSKVYDGTYFPIADLKPDDTTFVDTYVKPIETYYYSIVLNGMYESSVQSARVPGMLKSSEKNITTVNNFNFSQQGNVVTLSWDKADPHAHSYLLYRSNGDAQKLDLIKTIVSDSMHISVTDTVQQDVTNHLYRYVVRCRNTSYQLGPASQKISVMIYGTQRLPMPVKLALVSESNTKVKLIWQNQRDASVSGHIVYRKQVDANGKEITTFERIGKTMINQWTDTTLLSGKNYVYGVKNYGFDEQDISNMSPTVNFNSMPERIPGTEQLQASVAEGIVQLRWNNPVQVKLNRVEVYRAQEGTAPAKIAEVNASTSVFTDSKTKRGQTYYYFLKVVDAAGGESKLEGPAGIVVE